MDMRQMFDGHTSVKSFWGLDPPNIAGAYRGLWGPMGTYGGLLGSLGAYGGLWGPVGTYGGLRGPMGPMGVYGDLWGPIGTFGELLTRSRGGPATGSCGDTHR